MTMRLALALLVAVGLSACISPYKADIQQGNVVTPEMVEKLKTGMTRSQVRFVLGTPLVTDAFHADRWDYIYYFKRGADAPVEARHLTVIFQGDTLARIDGQATADSLTPLPVTAGSPEPSAPRSPDPGVTPDVRALDAVPAPAALP